MILQTRELLVQAVKQALDDHRGYAIVQAHMSEAEWESILAEALKLHRRGNP